MSGRFRSIMLDGHTLPALVPTAFQHQPSSARLHPLPEPVGLGTTMVVGLVCSKRHSCSLNFWHAPAGLHSQPLIEADKFSIFGRFERPVLSPNAIRGTEQSPLPL